MQDNGEPQGGAGVGGDAGRAPEFACKIPLPGSADAASQAPGQIIAQPKSLPEV